MSPGSHGSQIGPTEDSNACTVLGVLVVVLSATATRVFDVAASSSVARGDVLACCCVGRFTVGGILSKERGHHDV